MKRKEKEQSQLNAREYRYIHLSSIIKTSQIKQRKEKKKTNI